MMSYGGEQGRGGARSKERGRDEDAGEDIQDNNGTKMATASAMGRQLASRPQDCQEEPGPGNRCVRHPRSNRMTTSRNHWNHRADRRHHYRWASTLAGVMKKQSIQMWSQKRTDAWMSVEPPDPALCCTGQRA